MTRNLMSKITAPTAAIIAALIGLLGIIIGAIMNPLIEKWVNRPEPTKAPPSLAIEQIPQQVFAYAGNDNPNGGWGAFWLVYDEESIPVYKLEYFLPTDKYGYAGLAFQFTESQNLSDYNAIEFVVMFDQASGQIDLYVKDMGNHFNTIRVVGAGTGELALQYEFSNFPDINFNAVQEIGIIASTDFSIGGHQVRIKSIRLVR